MILNRFSGRLHILALLAVSALLAPSSTEAQQVTPGAGTQAVDAAIQRFDNGEWTEAVADLEALLASGSLSPSNRTRARKYAALGHLIVKDDGWHENTIRLFKDLVDEDPSFGMPDLALPGEEPQAEAVRMLGEAFFTWRQEELERTEARLRANTRTGSLSRSFVLPGWGQRYQGHRGRGWAMFGLAAGSVAWAVVADRSFRDARDAYDDAGVGADFDGLYQDYRDKADAADLALALVGAAWSLNLLDAGLSGPNLSGLTPLSVAPRDGGGIQLALQMEF